MTPPQVKRNIALSALVIKVTRIPEEPFKIIRNVRERATDLTGQEGGQQPPVALSSSEKHCCRLQPGSQAGSFLHLLSRALPLLPSCSQWPWPL